ncbi:unnamed protein product [Pipistrellus nathusii]|uniref:Uncharacterized protein n=1 Tax=Pipistrellus nathusii TaxID=59473 RepID=A0ABP0A9K9_PIPNA
MSRLAIYSVVTPELGWPPGARRESPFLRPPMLSLPPSWYTCSLSLSASVTSLMPLWFSLSPFLYLPLSWPKPRLRYPQQDSSVRLGLWRAASPLAGILVPGRQAGHYDCS